MRQCQEHNLTPRLDWIISRNGQTARLPCVNRSVGCGARVRVSEGKSPNEALLLQTANQRGDYAESYREVAGPATSARVATEIMELHQAECDDDSPYQRKLLGLVTRWKTDIESVLRRLVDEAHAEEIG